MTAYLIDDEPHCTDVLRVLLQKHCPEVTITGIFNDPEMALTALQGTPPDIVFLDIEMPVLNGFDLLRKCANLANFKLIFTTAYDQYAIKAFRFNALDYLLKPIDPTELKNAVAKASQSTTPDMAHIEAAQYLRSHPVPERIALPVGADLIMVDVADILYCESEGSYVSFFIKQQAKPTIVTKSLREIEELLNNPDFFRCHNSFLINLNHLKRIIRTEGGEIIMRNDKSIPVARAKKQELIRMVTKL